MGRKRSGIIIEDDVADYLAKKAQKQAMEVAKKLRIQNVSGYSNDSNPFGDSKLCEKFVWRKKIARDVARGVPLETFSLEAEKKRQRGRMEEIEKRKKRRELRAIEKAQREEEMKFLDKERARAEFNDWEKKEQEFLFHQSKVRSKIKMHEGRAKPIDILIKQLDPSSDYLNTEINEPYMVFKGLAVKELEELQEEIKLHLGLDRETPVHTRYWEALVVVCEWELAEARKRDVLDQARMHGEQVSSLIFAEERGMHSSIWQTVLNRLQIFKAKALLKETHAQVCQKHLRHLESVKQADDHCKNDVQIFFQESAPRGGNEAIDNDQEAGSYSPLLLQGEENEAAIDPELDRAILDRRRKAVLEKRCNQKIISRRTPSEDNYFEKQTLKAMGTMEEGDGAFGLTDEINLDSQVYWWHDKFQPRKPKYFSRVHTGYEWNKYNRTHYDQDNPPPKTVQGYKFNIFYTDLIDKSKAPCYTIEKDGDNEETCIIRFHGGAPYEDIAFRIVNKEWEHSKKKGFKCTFEQGILQLYFNFKRYRYRR